MSDRGKRLPPQTPVYLSWQQGRNGAVRACWPLLESLATTRSAILNILDNSIV
jgi:hypothetical protein